MESLTQSATHHLLVPATDRFPMSHAPYLATLGDARVMAIWFSGSREWAKDVHLLSAIYSPEKGSWEPIVDIVSDIGFSLGNSVVSRDVAGRYHLWYVRTKGYWHESEIVHMVWPDFQQHYTSKQVLPLERGWLVRGRPVLRGNVLYLPVYHEQDLVSTVWTQELSGEEGSLSEMISAPGGLIQPTLVDVQTDEFRCFMRNPRSPRKIHYCYSMDRGSTWSRAFPTSLPNPNSGIDVVRLDDSRLLCAYNDSEVNRYPMSLAVSENGGMDWRKVADLERLPGEYSYPSLLNTGKGLYLSYTYQREAIKFITLDPNRL